MYNHFPPKPSLADATEPLPSLLSSSATMAFPSAFQERLQQMEETRNQRIFLLQSEAELQTKKSQLLSTKLSNLRLMEQRCLLLERRIAEIRFQILAKKSEIDALDSRYQAVTVDFRTLTVEIAELEGCEKERDAFYEAKSLEMEEFKERVRARVVGCRLEVQNLRNSVSELNSVLKDFQGKDEYLNHPEIAAAESRKAGLLSTKEELERNLASNYMLRSLLQKQLQKMLIQDRGAKN